MGKKGVKQLSGEEEKARALDVTRYTLWRWRRGMAGDPRGQKPPAHIRKAIKQLDREFREKARREEEDRMARGE